MGSSRISSDTMVAKDAVSKLTSLVGDGIQNEKVEFSISTLPCMKNAQKLTNTMLTDIGELVETIQTQADKITGLAEVIENRDQLAGQSWGF
jgi:hypothetical protein